MARMIQTLAFAAVLAATCLVAPAAAACRSGTETTNGCVNVVGSSGQVEFCSNANAGTPGAAADYRNCFRMMPFGIAEVNATGSAVAASVSGQVRRIENLGSSLTLGAVASLSTAVCTEPITGVSACGSADVTASGSSGSGLRFFNVPVTASLAAMGGGTLSIQAMVFRDDGWFVYDGRNTSVKAGDFKFTVDVTGYTFQSEGTALELQVTARGFGAQSDSGSVTTDANGNRVVAGAMVNLPRFAARASATSSWEWADVSVTSETSGSSTTVIQYRFPGPFVQMSYDPSMQNPNNAGSSSSSSSASVAVATAATLAAAAALVAALV